MTWMTWRQHRSEVLAAALLAVLMTPVLIFSGQDLISKYQHGNYSEMRYQFEVVLNPLFIFLRLLPLLFGMFVGAPLMAGELERGTHRLAWTQSITRKRWFGAKLAWVGGISALAFGLLALVITRWSQPFQEILGPWETFDVSGSVLIAYALFALGLGVLLGTLFGKVLPAMAISIPVYLVVRSVVGYLLRPFYLPPLQAIWNLVGPDPQIKDLIVRQWFVDGFGNQVPTSLLTPCLQSPGGKGSALQCIHDLGYQYLRIYQPASRFWTFQAIETALFLALAVTFVALTYWWINHRIH